MKSFFAPLGVKLAAGGVAVLLVVIVWLWLGWSNEQSAHDKTLTKLGGEEARHAVTRQSVATLESELKKLVEEGEIRRARVTEAMNAVAKDTAPLRAEAERIAREGLSEDYARQLKEAGI